MRQCETKTKWREAHTCAHIAIWYSYDCMMLRSRGGYVNITLLSAAPRLPARLAQRGEGRVRPAERSDPDSPQLGR